MNLNQDKNDFSRRKFLKGGAVLGAAVGLSAITGKKATEEVAIAIGKKELDEFPHEIASDFKRFDYMNVIGERDAWDPEIQKKFEGLPGVNRVCDDSIPGNTTLDHMLRKGGWINLKDFTRYAYDWNFKKPSENKYEFSSKEDATKAIKKAAKFYDADLVGITPYDERWTYDPIKSFGNAPGEDMPFKPKSVIVMALEMKYEFLATAPSQLAEAEVGRVYSKMLEVTNKLSAFINGLGYKAFASGNDKALSVPYAIAAGLGEQGRNSILITYEYGPRVRLCKVFTEMELVYDKPIEFGANKFCQVCKKCAQSCPSQSLSFEDEMTFEPEYASISNHTGVKKYYLNTETCMEYWYNIGNGCGVCITSCPYNKPDFWHHRITTAMTATPLKPFLNEMDDVFGYGNAFDHQAIIDFWDLDVYTK